MKKFLSTLLLAHLALITRGQQTLVIDNKVPPRTFDIDYDNNTFRMDGKPFQFVAGSFHYFRALPETWQRKLRTMRAAGLTAVTTYVEWSLHNPKENAYDFTGIADLELFIELAAQEDLYVILRPGPYICAERDMGGFPSHLLNKYPGIQLRTYDLNYRYEVTKWYQVLMSKMQKYLYGNGGPIIMVQVENEYGSYFACDEKYRLWIRDETLKYTNEKAVLFTNDGPGVLRCGKIPGVLATLDFGAGSNETIDSYWATLRTFEPSGPLMNAEYYPGWLTHWQEEMQRVSTQPILDSLEKMLADGASVNFYMFYGGTNFGFTAGANDGGPGRYNSDVTSYDYDAPMDEAGDPTEKYFAIRKTIGKFFPLPKFPVPEPMPKVKLPNVVLRPVSTLLDSVSRKYLATYTKNSEKPMTFEALDQNSGFVLYETTLPKITRDPSLLKLSDLRDRAYVFINRQFVGILSRENKIYSIPISLALGNELQIVVENEGRINYGIANDFKGILGNAYFDTIVLNNWTMTGFPFENYDQIDELIAFRRQQKTTVAKNLLPSGSTVSRGDRGSDSHKPSLMRSYLRSGPTLMQAEFTLTDEMIGDTYLDPTGWGKGVIFINGFNLGRYWPLVGPQITIYVPKEILKVGTNKIAMLELQKAPDSGVVTFSDTPNLDGNFE